MDTDTYTNISTSTAHRQGTNRITNSQYKWTQQTHITTHIQTHIDKGTRTNTIKHIDTTQIHMHICTNIHNNRHTTHPSCLPGWGELVGAGSLTVQPLCRARAWFTPRLSPDSCMLQQEKGARAEAPQEGWLESTARGEERSGAGGWPHAPGPGSLEPQVQKL